MSRILGTMAMGNLSQCDFMEIESKILERVINDLVSSVLKSTDAPCSSGAHMDCAIATLVKLCPDWKGWSPESEGVVSNAKEHMAYYK